MAASLTPRIIAATDTALLEPGTGAVRHVLRVRFLVGELGPFNEDFEPGADRYVIEQRLAARAAIFQGLV